MLSALCDVSVHFGISQKLGEGFGKPEKDLLLGKLSLELENKFLICIL